MIGERRNNKNIESLDLTRKVNLLRLLRGNNDLLSQIKTPYGTWFMNYLHFCILKQY